MYFICIRINLKNTKKWYYFWDMRCAPMVDKLAMKWNGKFVNVFDRETMKSTKMILSLKQNNHRKKWSYFSDALTFTTLQRMPIWMRHIHAYMHRHRKHAAHLSITSYSMLYPLWKRIYPTITNKSAVLKDSSYVEYIYR